MISFFSIPKPFEGHIGIIQKNAINSWKNSNFGSEIILLGDEPGIEEICAELGLTHIKPIRKNEYGTPFLNDAFRIAQKIAKFDLICYVNSDIIITNNFCEAIIHFQFKKFLLVGRKCNVSLDYLIDFSHDAWKQQIIDLAKSNGKMLGDTAIDYFLFKKGIFFNIPPFLVGRAGWDNWLIYHTRRLHIPVIDATPSIKVIHQTHDYRHIKNQRGKWFYGDESDKNLQLIKYPLYYWNIRDANWELKNNKPLRKRLKRRELFNKVILAAPVFTHPLVNFIDQYMMKIGIG